MMFETTSVTTLLTLDEPLYNLFCLTTASVHIPSLFIPKDSINAAHCAAWQHNAHTRHKMSQITALHLANIIYSPNSFKQWKHLLLFCGSSHTEADGMGTLFTCEVPKPIHFIYDGQNLALHSHLSSLGPKTLLFYKDKEERFPLRLLDNNEDSFYSLMLHSTYSEHLKKLRVEVLIHILRSVQCN